MYRLVIIVLALATVSAPSFAETRSVDGALDGVAYRIAKPDNWNGGLVLFAHGYQGDGPGPGDLEGPPIDRHITDRGFAWAASAFRAKGYRPDWFLSDTLAVRDHFIRTYGPPRWTIIYAQSMGAHAAIFALEHRPEIFQGALLECGVVDGITLFDWRYAYAAAAEYLSGLPILDTSQDVFATLRISKVFNLIMGTPGDYTARGRQLDSIARHLAGGDLPHRLEGWKIQYSFNISPNSRSYGPPGNVDTRKRHYEIDPGLGLDEAAFNRAVRRATPAAGLRSDRDNPVFTEFTGAIRVPVLSIHETADFRVPFRQEMDYRRRTVAAGTSHLLVQRAQRHAGHCEFTGAIRQDSFDDLVTWIESGKVPTGDDVLGDPAKLGLGSTP
jgi:pimeloyl-ACP methyl ester carboxylesterase